MALSEQEIKICKDKFAIFISERKKAKTILENYLKKIEKAISDGDIPRLMSASKTLEQYLADYLEHKEEIVNLVSMCDQLKDTEIYEILAARAKEVIVEVSDSIRFVDENRPKVPESTPPAEINIVHNDLPKLEHFTFNGKDSSEWPVFWDNFLNLIDSNKS